MKFSTTLSALLCATGAIATEWAEWTDVTSDKRSANVVEKRSALGNSHRAIPAPAPKGPSRVQGKKKADAFYYNWSGAIKYASAGELVTSVAATFTMPTPSVPTGKPAGSYSGAAWVGLGGAVANDSLWQAGGVWSVDNTKSPVARSYGVWYEWLPNALIQVPNFPTAAGHVIVVNLHADRPGTGQVVIADRTSGQTTTITTSAPNPTATLKGATAEWITEDLESGGGLLPYANYGKVRYTGCKYGDFSGSTGNLSNVTLAQGVSQSSNKVNSMSTKISNTEVDTTFQPANA